jgi:NTE family protein
MIVANATDLSSGSRFYFAQTMFDIMCSDLSAVRVSRAAAASSAVPLVFSPLTFNNYGGSCGFHEPSWLKLITDPAHPVRPAARALRELQELKSFGDAKDRPYVHLVDGGVADNLAMRGILNIFDEIEALRLVGAPTPLDRVRRVVVVVVNSLSTPKTDWDKRESAPGPIDILLKVTGVPIDHYSYEAVELLSDTAARWQTMRAMRDASSPADRTKPAFREAIRVPNAEIFVVDVSFARVSDTTEREYLNQLPTSFSLPGEAVDRLREAAKEILLESAGFRKYAQELGTNGYKVETRPVGSRAKGHSE